MSAEDPKILAYHSLPRSEYRVLLRLDVTQEEADDAFSEGLRLRLDLGPVSRTDMRILRLRFDNVRTLKISQPPDSGFCVFPLEIVSIGDHQWEGVRYKVFHDEHHPFITFMCKDFSAAIIDEEE